jgi:hypothetical protein
MVWCHNNLVGGQTAVRHVDANVIAVERLGYQVGKPGSLAAISKDPITQQRITVQTSFGAHAHLHDYTGNAPDIWTDGAGRAEITIPSNYYGAGNSYVCYSHASVGQPQPRASRSITQTFFGADDLDIAPAYNGRHIIGRIWCAAGTKLNGALIIAKPPDATMNLIISDAAGILSEMPVGTGGIAFPQGSSGTRPNSTVPRDGWISFALSSTGLPDEGLPFELQCTYTGTKGLPRV